MHLLINLNKKDLGTDPPLTYRVVKGGCLVATLSCADSLVLVSDSNEEPWRVMLMPADPTVSTHRKQTDEVRSCYSYTRRFQTWARKKECVCNNVRYEQNSY